MLTNSLRQVTSDTVSGWSCVGNRSTFPFPWVRTFGVIMLAEVCQGTTQRGFAEQNELGKTFALDRAYPPLRKRIGVSPQMRGMATLKVDVSE